MQGFVTSVGAERRHRVSVAVGVQADCRHRSLAEGVGARLWYKASVQATLVVVGVWVDCRLRALAEGVGAEGQCEALVRGFCTKRWCGESA